jgi:SAM-dependent methyltransferase
VTQNNAVATKPAWTPKETVGGKGIGLRGLIVRDRELALLRCLDNLTAAEGSVALEIGRECSGMTIAAAKKNFSVVLQVLLPAIAARARANGMKSGFGENVSVLTGTVSTTPFRDSTFDLVTAVNVFPWDPSYDRTLGEIRRILKPGGHLITMFQNRWRLSRLFDPRLTPLLAPHLINLKRWSEKVRGRDPRVATSIPVNHSIGEVTSILSSKGLKIVWEHSVGFGPFSFLGKRIMTDRMGKTVHSFLQRLADHPFPFVSKSGSYYIVLIRKSE